MTVRPSPVAAHMANKRRSNLFKGKLGALPLPHFLEHLLTVLEIKDRLMWCRALIVVDRASHPVQDVRIDSVRAVSETAAF